MQKAVSALNNSQFLSTILHALFMRYKRPHPSITSNCQVRVGYMCSTNSSFDKGLVTRAVWCVMHQWANNNNGTVCAETSSILISNTNPIILIGMSLSEPNIIRKTARYVAIYLSVCVSVFLLVYYCQCCRHTFDTFQPCATYCMHWKGFPHQAFIHAMHMSGFTCMREATATSRTLPNTEKCIGNPGAMPDLVASPSPIHRCEKGASNLTWLLPKRINMRRQEASNCRTTSPSHRAIEPPHWLNATNATRRRREGLMVRG